MKAFSLFLLVFMISSVMSTIFIDSIDSDPQKTLHQVLIHVIFECRQDIHTVFVYDENKMFTIDQLSFEKRPVPIIFYNNVMINSYDSHLPSSKIDAFISIIHTSREQEWEQIRKAIEGSYGLYTSWKTVAPFYVVNLNEKQCNAAHANVLSDLFFHSTILESYLICRKENESAITLFTFNSYDSKAPQPWIPVEYYYPDSRTMLFNRNFDKNICTNLYFNRMKYLDGYVINIAVPLWNESVPRDSLYYNKDEIDLALYPPDRIYVETLAIAFQLKISYTFFNPNNSDSVSEVFTECGFQIISLLSYNGHGYSCYDALYPTDFETFSFVTHSRGLKTPLERIKDYYGIWTLVSMLVLLSLTFIVIWRIRRDWSFAGFEVIRLLINSEVTVEINNLSKKIFFSMIFLYFLVFHATFSGRLIEFLTEPELRKNPETIDDLADDPQYTEIITTFYPWLYLRTHRIHKKLNGSHFIDECFEKVSYSTSIACIDFHSNLRDKTIVKRSQMRDSPYHLPKMTFGFLYKSIYGSPFSSMTPSINNAYMKAVEAGLFERRKQNYDQFEALKIQIAEMTRSTYVQPLTLQNLQFIFFFLGFGLTFATIIFIAELYLRSFYLPKFKSKLNSAKFY